jgi:phosphohistidine swiveling domain-containing protein
MGSRRCFRPEIHLQAESIARQFFSRVGQALGCSPMQVLFGSADEIQAALAGGAALPLEEIDRRIAGGFTVVRTGDTIEVTTPGEEGGRAPAPPVLSGMTGYRGRAVGRARIILDVAGLHRLGVGDILVTAASTTDMLGGSTVFPTRGGGPDALERAAAVVADEGGLLSHAAIVCRERGIPFVLGTERATETLVDGQVIEVDATSPTGRVIPL